MARSIWGILFLIGCALNAASQEAAPPVKVPPAELQHFLIKRVAPVYPPLARQARIQGTVFLNVVVNKAGEVRDVVVVSGHPMLVSSAVEAVRKWRYAPYEKDGESVDVTTTVQVNFRIADEPLASSGDGAHLNNSGTPSQPSESADCADIENPRVSVPGQRVRVSSGVASGLIVTKVPPRYPEDARQARVQGTVVLTVDISKEGNVCKTELISGQPLLAPAAIEAVQQWKYKPYLLSGVAVEVETQVQINFELKEPKPST